LGGDLLIDLVMAGEIKFLFDINMASLINAPLDLHELQPLPSATMEGEISNMGITHTPCSGSSRSVSSRNLVLCIIVRQRQLVNCSIGPRRIILRRFVYISSMSLHFSCFEKAPSLDIVDEPTTNLAVEELKYSF
jgi:hypothetical protein